MQDDGMGSERVDIVCWALPKTIPSYLGSFTFCRRSVMPEAPLSIIARASGRQYLVYRSLYRGFPQPHIRTCHRSIEENPLAAKWKNVSSHDILRYFNTRFYQVTFSDLLRRTPKYSGDLLLILFK